MEPSPWFKTPQVARRKLPAWAVGQASKLFSVTFGPDGRVLDSAIADDPRETRAN